MKCFILLCKVPSERRDWFGVMVPIFTTRKRSLGQGNIFAPVCHSVHRGSAWAGTPRDQVHPRGPGTPWVQVHPPGTRYTPQDQVPSGPGTPPMPGTRYTPHDQVHPPPLGPGTSPPGAVHAGRYGQQAGGTHPTGMHSCLIYFLK